MEPSGSSKTPLAGMRAAVVCSEASASQLVSGLKLLGAAVLMLPLLRIRPLRDRTAIDVALNDLDNYDWVIFTSSYGVRFFLERMAEQAISRDRLSRLNVCAIGPATSKKLRQVGIRVTMVPDDFVAEGILDSLAARYGSLQNLAGLRFLIPRALKARDILPYKLSETGAVVNVLPCYENILGTLSSELRQDINARPPDLFVFTSSSGVTSLLSALGEQTGVRLLRRAVVAAIGPATAATLRQCGKKAEILPDRSSLPDLLRAIGDYFGEEANWNSREHGPR